MREGMMIVLWHADAPQNHHGDDETIPSPSLFYLCYQQLAIPYYLNVSLMIGQNNDDWHSKQEKILESQNIVEWNGFGKSFLVFLLFKTGIADCRRVVSPDLLFTFDAFCCIKCSNQL